MNEIERMKQPDTTAGRRLLRVILDATGPNFDLALGIQPSEAIRAIETEARSRERDRKAGTKPS